MAKVTILSDICKGCGLCVEVCKKNALKLSEDILNAKGHHPAEWVDADACTGCGNCGLMCPDSVITVER